MVPSYDNKVNDYKSLDYSNVNGIRCVPPLLISTLSGQKKREKTCVKKHMLGIRVGALGGYLGLFVEGFRELF